MHPLPPFPVPVVPARLRLVVGIGLGQVLLQESEVLLGTGVALASVSGHVLGGSGGRSESGLGSVELGELGREVGGKGRSLGRGRGGVRLDDSDVGVLGLQSRKTKVSKRVGLQAFQRPGRRLNSRRTWATGL